MLQVPVMPSHLVRASWVLSLVQAGSRFPLQGQVSSHIRQSLDCLTAASAQGESCSLYLPPLEGRCLVGMEAVVPLQFLHQGLPAQEPRCFLHSTEQVPFSYPPVDNRLCLHGFKTGYFNVPQLERLGKTFTPADTHRK